MMTVYDLKVGQKATIYDIAGDIRLAKRLIAPFGDPIVINFRGLNLALRKNDAKNITIR